MTNRTTIDSGRKYSARKEKKTREEERALEVNTMVRLCSDCLFDIYFVNERRRRTRVCRSAERKAAEATRVYALVSTRGKILNLRNLEFLLNFV